MDILVPMHTTHEPRAALRHDSIALPRLRSLPATTVDIAVLGGTLSGLAAAIVAAEAGARVLVLEGASALRDDETLAQLAERARTAGVTLAGEARVLHYEEEQGCANTTHWRLEAKGGITIPARGLVVAYDEERAAYAGPGASASRRLGSAAPGLAIGGGSRENMLAAINAGTAAGAEIASLVMVAGSDTHGMK